MNGLKQIVVYDLLAHLGVLRRYAPLLCLEVSSFVYLTASLLQGFTL